MTDEPKTAPGLRANRDAGAPQGGATRKVGAVMVVGAGIGGMQAALDLANAGFHVTLVEETTAIGGRMAQLDKTFPSNDCSMCTISPRLIEVGKSLNIDLVTNADVESIAGQVGDFAVQVKVRPRFVDLVKCNACGDCVERCPVRVPSEHDLGLGTRKAIHKRYPQAIPGGMAISKAERAPCVMTCPANVAVQGYLALIADGRIAEAYKLIRDRNPLPSICGRICHHPCEARCNRTEIDEAVAINPLKRFAADWVQSRVEAGDADTIKKACDAKPALDLGKPKVAIVGSGPAGLTAARDLARQGFPVTIFEQQSQLGGMLRWGIPRYRLPTATLDFGGPRWEGTPTQKNPLRNG